MITGVLPYLSIIFFSWIFSSFKLIKYEKEVFFWITVLLFLVSIFRYNIGADYATYVEMFEYINLSLTFDDIFIHTEPLYFILNKLVYLFSSNSILLFISVSIIIYSTLYKAIKSVSTDYVFSLFLYIVTTYYFISLNQIRQSISLVLFLYSLSALINDKKIKYLVINTVAILFHYSAIFTLIPLLVKDISIKKRTYLVILSLSIILSTRIDILLSDKLLLIDNMYTDYLNNDHFIEKNNSALFKQLVPNAIVLLSIFKMDLLPKKALILFNIYFLGVVYLNIFYGKNIFIRPAFYFDIVIIIYLPIFLYYLIPSDRYLRWGIQFIISIYYIALTVYGIFLNGGQGVVPYKTFF